MSSSTTLKRDLAGASGRDHPLNSSYMHGDVRPQWLSWRGEDTWATWLNLLCRLARCCHLDSCSFCFMLADCFKTFIFVSYSFCCTACIVTAAQLCHFKSLRVCDANAYIWPQVHVRNIGDCPNCCRFVTCSGSEETPHYDFWRSMSWTRCQ